MKLQVLYEDNHLIAVVKPFGVPSQGDQTGDESMLDLVKAYVKEKYAKPGDVYLGLVHRLDRPVGGVMVFARTSKAAARLSEQFRDRETEKAYWAITERIPAEPGGQLIHYLKKLPDQNIVRAHSKQVHGSQEAKLAYEVLATREGRALLAVALETGRRHQIRVQLAASGWPIVGDVKYGKTEFLPDKSIALMARSLKVTHPVTKAALEWQAPWPDTAPWKDFQSAISL